MQRDNPGHVQISKLACSEFLHLFGINPALAENPIFYILMFQGPKRRPNELKIYGDHFLEETKRWEKGWKKVEARRPKGGAHAATVLGHGGPPILALVAPFASILRPKASS